MTTREAAALLGVTERHIRHLITHGVLQATRRGRDWWITPEAVEAAKNRPGLGRPRKGEERKRQ